MATSKPSKSQSSNTYLDKSKFCVDQKMYQSESQDFAMPESHRYREMVWEAMDKAGYKEGPMQRFLDCCKRATVYRHVETGKVKVTYETCGSRLCPNCRIRYQAQVAQRIEAALGGVKQNTWRFITLTIKSVEKPLEEQIKELKAAFRRLRQSIIWSQTQMFGFAVVEVTINPETNLWHPHLHVLSRGLYLPQRKLSRQWEQASRGSTVVDIRPVKSGGNAAKYVAKYMGKPPKVEEAREPQRLMNEYVQAMKGTHMLFSFGPREMTSIVTVPMEREDPGEGWEPVGDLNTIIARAKNGEKEARGILERLKSGQGDPDQPSLIDSG